MPALPVTRLVKTLQLKLIIAHVSYIVNHPVYVKKRGGQEMQEPVPNCLNHQDKGKTKPSGRLISNPPVLLLGVLVGNRRCTEGVRFDFGTKVIGFC